MRLDAALAFLLPDTGLRARRRLWKTCRVTVNGSSRKPGDMVKQGDIISLERASSKSPLSDVSRPELPSAVPRSLLSEISLLDFTRDFVALKKPVGLHSAHIAGSLLPSLQSVLPYEWTRLYTEWVKRGASLNRETLTLQSNCADIVPQLLTRLDFGTSGIILAAMNEEVITRFREMEHAGLVQKTYVALLRGRLEKALLIDRRLRVDNRALTTVLDNQEPDPARYTYVEPFNEIDLSGPAFENNNFTLARINIRRGSRHQIRAHLASAGFPLLGEWQYARRIAYSLKYLVHSSLVKMSGNNDNRALAAGYEFDDQALYLHHGNVAFPGVSVTCSVAWAQAVPRLMLPLHV